MELIGEKVYNGSPGYIGCGLEVFNGEIYSIVADFSGGNVVKILKSSGGAFTEVYTGDSSGDHYIREIVAYDGKLYVYGVKGSGSSYTPGYVLVSSDGSTWEKEGCWPMVF